MDPCLTIPGMVLGACPSNGSGRAAGSCEPQPRNEEEAGPGGRRRQATKYGAATPGCPKGCGGAPPSAASPLFTDHYGRIHRGSLHLMVRRPQRGPSHYSDRLLADRVARFSLDPTRPVPLLDDATLERFRRCLGAAGQADARVLVIAGGTQGVFAAGADLAQLGPADARKFSRKGQVLFESLKSHDFVSIAAVRGRCIGGAYDLVMACDLRLGDTTAVFSHPGQRLGFITGYGGTSRLPALIGPESTPPEELERRVAEIAGELCVVFWQTVDLFQCPQEYAEAFDEPRNID